MARFNEISLSAKPPVEKHDADDRTCMAHGCPRIATINSEGRWICRYHKGKAAKDWNHITLKLRNHEREVNWFEWLQQSTFTDYEEKTGRDGKKYPGTVDATILGQPLRRVPLTQAPPGMENGQMESFSHYRRRMGDKINSMLYGHEPVVDRKMMAAGELA